MNIKQSAAIFLFIIVNATVTAQEDTTGYFVQHALVYDAFESVVDFEDLILFEQLLNNPEITLDKVRAEIYIGRAKKHWDLITEEYYEAEWEETDDFENIYLPKRETEIQEIVADYDNAIALCPQCAVQYQFDRFMFLEELVGAEEDLKRIENTYLKDYELANASMTKMGYKEERYGVGIGLSAFIGDDFWLGGEASVANFVSPMNRLKYKNPQGEEENYWVSIYPTVAGWLTLGYHYGLNSTAHDFNMSFAQITSPIHLEFTKFGFVKADYSSNLVWYYRPEIGFGFQNISFYYAYNAVFKKDMRNLSERHLFGVKVKFNAFRFKSNVPDRVAKYRLENN